jgi:hypothetical protein
LSLENLNPEATKLSAESLNIIKYIRVALYRNACRLFKCRFEEGERLTKINKPHMTKVGEPWAMTRLYAILTRGWEVIV